MPRYPGPLSQAMLNELAGYVVATPQPFAVDLAASEGMYLVTVEGQRLFDWAGYYGSKLLGHNHPGLYDPEYLKRLVTVANNKVANPDFLTPECLDYYRLLYKIAPESMRNPNLEVYVLNSGAEAVENMMKYLVSRFNRKQMRKGRPIGNRRFLYFDRAFHGRTVFALGVTQTIDPVATKDFHGLTTGGNIMLPFPSYDSGDSPEKNLAHVRTALSQVESALRLMSDEIVGVIVEPIQGAGGQRVALKEFFVGLSKLCHQYDVYFAFDEVQTGIVSTGRMWGHDHFDLPHPPKAIACGKKLGNGAVYMHEPLEDIGVLDSTWGGSLTDMVRFGREMEIVEQEGLMENAATMGERLSAGLHQIVDRHSPLVFNVRGLGLYQGVSFETPELRSKVIETAREDFDLLLLGAGNRSLRTRPAASVTAAEVDRFLDLFDHVLTRVRG